MKNQSQIISIERKKINIGKKIKRFWPVYLMVLPGLAYLLVNNYLPMFGISIAFRELDMSVGILRSPFNGLENFRFLFETGVIWTYIRNTILYNLVFIALGIVVPITVAILFSTLTKKLPKRLYQTSILLPNLMSWVVVSYIGFAFFSSENGFINSIFSSFGGNRIDFYNEPKYWPFILTFFNLWKGIGMAMIVYLASILGISGEYYEAAKLDGASFFQQVKYITLPCLRPTIITLFILSISKIFYSDFGLFYLVTKNSGSLYNVTQTIDTYVFNALMNNQDIANSSAASVMQSLVGFVLVITANTIVRKFDRDSAIF